ncbi:YihY/virulence factor BrkB family protein [uncultured Lacinutrix sp.]|uniref:YihY/virulence factor BrkB family protein n=1 Tax=uncultured Lacinutrix sp. TaxID=574032 RepID=UPI002615120A|nr:YihY/virulence factor BrkB family protein [uncultured Lacinutrix sp.]
MSQEIEAKLAKIPVVNLLVKLLTKIKLPGLEGLSLYDLLELYVIGIAKGALGSRASAIAYSFFMALFPFLLFLFVVIPHIPIEDFQTDFLAFLESFLPPTTTEFFDDNIFKNINNSSGLISTVFVASIFLMTNGVNALFSGFENSYHEQSTRNVVKQYIYALGVAIILAFLLILTVVGLGYFQIYVVDNVLVMLDDYGYDTKRETDFWASLAQYAFFVIMCYLATATLYYFGTKEGRHSKFFSVGALFTTLLIMLNSFLFGLYIENFAQYNKLYGSIGALLILMFYLWLNANLLLLGFELNMSLKRLKQQHHNNE